MARWGKERVEEVILGRARLCLFFCLFFSSSLLMSRTRPQRRIRRPMVPSSTSGLLFKRGKLTLSFFVGVAKNVAWLLADGEGWDDGLVMIGEGGEEKM